MMLHNCIVLVKVCGIVFIVWHINHASCFSFTYVLSVVMTGRKSRKDVDKLLEYGPDADKILKKKSK